MLNINLDKGSDSTWAKPCFWAIRFCSLGIDFLILGNIAVISRINTIKWVPMHLYKHSYASVPSTSAPLEAAWHFPQTPSLPRTIKRASPSRPFVPLQDLQDIFFFFLLHHWCITSCLHMYHAAGLPAANLVYMQAEWYLHLARRRFAMHAQQKMWRGWGAFGRGGGARGGKRERWSIFGVIQWWCSKIKVLLTHREYIYHHRVQYV